MRKSCKIVFIPENRSEFRENERLVSVSIYIRKCPQKCLPLYEDEVDHLTVSASGSGYNYNETFHLCLSFRVVDLHVIPRGEN